MTDDRIKGPIADFVRGLFPTYWYFGRYPSKVAKQNDNGTLELVPEDVKVPGLSEVPIRLGLPGASVRVAAGSRVLLGFEGGRPSQPFAELWDISTCTELKLNGTTIILNGGTAKVARVGDTISATIPPGAVDVGGFPSVAPITLSGTITSGADGVKA